MRSIHPRDRRKRIAELVRDTGFCKSSELSELLGVSEMTIRRDIRWLEENGLVLAVHGGVRITQTVTGDYDFQSRMENNKEAKQAVAKRACSFIEANTMIGLDSGTTTYRLAQHLPIDMNLTVVTHSLPIMNEISTREDIELISLGGSLRKNTQGFVGPLALLAIQELRVSTFFLAARAIREGVLFSGNPYDADIKRAMIGSAEKVTLIVNSSKFHSTAGIRIAPIEEVNMIIVDDRISIDEQMIPGSVELITVPLQHDS